MSISTVIKKVSMAVTGTAFISLVSAMPSMAVTINFDGDTTGGQTWNRPIPDGSNAPTSLAGGFANATRYTSQQFFVDTSGLYNFFSKSISPSSWDNVTFLYQTSFDPTTPLTNVLIGNDDFSTKGQSGFDNVSLTAGTQYFFVNTGLANDQFGTFTSSISGSGQITLGNVADVPEPVHILGTLIGTVYGVGLCRKYKHLKKTIKL